MSRAAQRFFVAGLALLAGCAAHGARALDRVRPTKPPPPSRPCEPADIPPNFLKTGRAVLQNIPDRRHEPGHPKQGWCGECALQQALLYCGGYFPQKHINRAGKPRHPDLYASDIPVAMKALGSRYDWAPEPRSLPKFLAWVRKQIKAGHPVFTGVKINPTKHPEWGLDHFVLVAGCDPNGLTFNTTWARQVRRTDEQLASRKLKGFAYANGRGAYYALRITGAARAPGEATVHLFVTKETSKSLDAIVKCEGLTPGATYVLTRSTSFSTTPAPFAAFQAFSSVYAFRVTFAQSAPAVFRCRLRR